MELARFFPSTLTASVFTPPSPLIQITSNGKRWGSDGLFQTKLPLPPIDQTHYADSIFRVAIVGEGSIGKTTLTRRWIDNKYDPTDEGITGRTIGVDFKSAVVDVNLPRGVTKRIKLQLWDTAGQERYRCLAPSMLRKIHAAFVCYDVSDPESAVSVRRWIDCVRKYNSDDVFIVIVGLKADKAISNEGQDEIERIIQTESKLAHVNSLVYEHFSTPRIIQPSSSDTSLETIDLSLSSTTATTTETPSITAIGVVHHPWLAHYTVSSKSGAGVNALFSDTAGELFYRMVNDSSWRQSKDKMDSQVIRLTPIPKNRCC